MEYLEGRALLSVYVYGKSATAVEGSAFNGTIAEFYDSAASTNANDFQVSVDWGDFDSSPGKAVPETNYPGWFTVTGTHTYPSNRYGNTYFATVSVKKSSDGSSGSSPSTVTFTDAPLTASGSPISATAGKSFNGVVATFSDADPGASAGYFRTTINWGDNTGLSGGSIASTGSGKFSVTGIHTYAAAGSYSVSIQIYDASSTATATSTATVKQDQPGISISEASVNEGDSGPTAATFTVSL